MAWLVVDSIPPYDGRYELEMAGDQFTTREWGWIKRFSGYLPADLETGLRGFDAELFCSYAVIALHRAGKIDSRDAADVFDRIQDAPFGSTVRLHTSDIEEQEEEGEALPPPQPPSSNENGSSSGHDSTTSSGTSANAPNRSGIPDSVISGSVSPRSGT